MFAHSRREAILILVIVNLIEFCDIPIIAVGGIHSAQDALDKIEAGADLVQIYTGFIYEGPRLVKSINKALLNINAS